MRQMLLDSSLNIQPIASNDRLSSLSLHPTHRRHTMQLTDAGQIFLAASAASLVAAFGLGRRMSRHMQPGKGTNAFWVIVLFAMIALFVPFTLWTSQSGAGFLSSNGLDLWASIRHSCGCSFEES